MADGRPWPQLKHHYPGALRLSSVCVRMSPTHPQAHSQHSTRPTQKPRSPGWHNRALCVRGNKQMSGEVFDSPLLQPHNCRTNEWNAGAKDTERIHYPISQTPTRDGNACYFTGSIAAYVLSKALAPLFLPNLRIRPFKLISFHSFLEGGEGGGGGPCINPISPQLRTSFFSSFFLTGGSQLNHGHNCLATCM